MNLNEKTDLILQMLVQNQGRISVFSEFASRGLHVSENEVQLILRQAEGLINMQRRGTEVSLILSGVGEGFTKVDSFSKPGTPVLNLVFTLFQHNPNTPRVQQAVSLIKSTLISTNLAFDLQLSEWRFAMFPELHLYFANKKEGSLYFMYDFEEEEITEHILSKILSELYLQESCVDYGNMGKRLKGRYLICYYKPLQLLK